jgi:hypothetical protein
VAPPPGSALAEVGWDRAAGAAHARAQADALGLDRVIPATPATGGAAPAAGDPEAPWGVRALGELASAALAAAGIGAPRLVWPVALGSDVDAMFAATELTALITRAGWLRGMGGSSWGDGEGVVVETPFVDLSTGQLRELLEDLGGSETLCTPPEGAPAAA